MVSVNLVRRCIVFRFVVATWKKKRKNIHLFISQYTVFDYADKKGHNAVAVWSWGYFSPNDFTIFVRCLLVAWKIAKLKWQWVGTSFRIRFSFFLQIITYLVLKVNVESVFSIQYSFEKLMAKGAIMVLGGVYGAENSVGRSPKVGATTWLRSQKLKYRWHRTRQSGEPWGRSMSSCGFLSANFSPLVENSTSIFFELLVFFSSSSSSACLNLLLDMYDLQSFSSSCQ